MFNKNLHVLRKMLVAGVPTHRASGFSQQDNDVYARAASNESMANPASFFGLTRFSGFFNGSANQSATAGLNGPALTQNLSRL